MTHCLSEERQKEEGAAGGEHQVSKPQLATDGGVSADRSPEDEAVSPSPRPASLHAVTSPCFLLCLLQNSWVPRRGDQGPKTIDQIHKEAEMEEHREHIKVQQLMSKQDKRRGPPGPSSAGELGEDNLLGGFSIRAS